LRKKRKKDIDPNILYAADKVWTEAIRETRKKMESKGND